MSPSMSSTDIIEASYDGPMRADERLLVKGWTREGVARAMEKSRYRAACHSVRSAIRTLRAIKAGGWRHLPRAEQEMRERTAVYELRGALARRRDVMFVILKPALQAAAE